jgi:hypothetical protein
MIVSVGLGVDRFGFALGGLPQPVLVSRLSAAGTYASAERISTLKKDTA